LKEFKGKDGI